MRDTYTVRNTFSGENKHPENWGYELHEILVLVVNVICYLIL